MEDERIEEQVEETVTLEEVRDGLLEAIQGGLADEEAELAKSVRETEMAEAKSKRETEAALTRSKNELIGNGLRTGGQIGAAIVAGWVSIVTVARIINAEDHDKLILSKAIGFVLKPRG